MSASWSSPDCGDWCILGVGNFALEVFDWSCDALGEGAREHFIGFVGDADGVAPSTTGLPAIADESVDLSCAEIVNAIAMPAIKKKVCEKLLAAGARFRSIIHPSAIVRATEIGVGAIICPGAVVGAKARYGRFVTQNYLSGVGHETTLADFVTLSPSVQLGGVCMIGEGTFFGASAVAVDNVKVGAWVQVNAGAVVISRIRDGAKVSGNPARRVAF